MSAHHGDRALIEVSSSDMATNMWDVVIAGAGPAGLSAALVLGRARRKVLLCDTGTPRSWASKEMHGFLTRDGVPPAEFRRLAHKELTRYPGVGVPSSRGHRCLAQC